MLTRPACILPRADCERLDLITGDLFFLKTPNLPLVVGVVDVASLDVDEVVAAGERSLEAESRRGVDLSFEAAANFF